jgi:hypothetical protein
MMRRVLAITVVSLLAVPTVALADDLDGMMDDAAVADFEATGIVMCSWGDDSVAASYEVTRSDGMTMVHGPEGDLMLSGAFSAARSDGGWLALEVGGWTERTASDRYTISQPRSVVRLGRPATETDVLEGSAVRVRLVLDDETSVPLLTEVFGADGEPYRMAALIEFVPSVAVPLDMPDDMPEHDMLMPTDPSVWLPPEAAGYHRSDTYEMKGTSQAFYSDGLFSFSVFETRRGPMPPSFSRASAFRADGGIYRRIVTPSVVWVHWDAPDRSYVLVGDLPPDHLAAVLAELPAPGNRTVLIRLWRRLFG